jgi:HPr kinase/phosphorylase
MGMTEISFIKGLSDEVRKERIGKLLSYELPCIIITRNQEPPVELLELAREKKRWLLRTTQATTRFISRLTNFLESELAPRTTVHGVLMDIYGVGVLLQGESGIGKSETAVELIKRGHRLVADDAVEIKQVAKNVLVGMAPELIKYYIEVRGLGIIDVKTIFGAGAVRDDIRIDLVLNVVEWDKFREFDRLGIREEKTTILDSTVPLKTIPIRPGRNLAAIIEVAAMNHRLIEMGYNAALQFSRRVYDGTTKKKE